MGAESKIEWTTHTFNPWWGCVRVSPACGGARGVGGCYAEAFSKRIGGSPWAKGSHWGPNALRTIASEKMWHEPLRWNAAAEKAGVRARVFCASMADVCEDRRDLDAPRARLRALINLTPHLDWLLLTKRPENFVRLMGWPGEWPRNVWAGTTVESQKYADERIPHLLSVPAAVRFLSCEPLLDSVDVRRFVWDDWFCPTCDTHLSGSRVTPDERCDTCGTAVTTAQLLHWVIVGGESGPGARVFDLAWARSIVAQCKAAGVSVFVKQLGAVPVTRFYDDEERARWDAAGFEWPDPIGWDETDGQPRLDALVNIRGRNKKGGDWNEWPEDLRVREFPKGGAE